MLQYMKDRNEKIRKDFARLWGDGQRMECILKKLAEKYYMKEGTVYQIIKRYGGYKEN